MSISSDWPMEAPHSETPTSNRETDFVRVILGRKLLLLFCIGVGCALGYLQFTKSDPVYASTARVHVAQQAQPLPIEGLAELMAERDPLDTHVVRIKSPLIIEKAVEKHDLGSLPSLAGRNAVAAVISGLSVSRLADSKEVLEITYSGPNRFDCAKIVAGVVAAYVDFLGETTNNMGEKAVTLISEAKDNLSKQLRDKEQEYVKFREGAALMWQGQEALNIHQQRLAGIEENRSSILIEQSRLRAELSELETAMRNGSNREALMLMVNRLDREKADGEGQAGRGLETTLFPLMLEVQMLSEQLGKDHPKVIEARRKLEVLRSFDQSNEAGTLTGARRSDFLTVYVDMLRQQLRTNDGKLKSLGELFKQEEQAAKLLSADEARHRVLQDELNRTKKLFDVVVEQLQEINLTKETGTFMAELITPPGPGYQVAPNLQKLVSLGGVGGLLAGLLFSFLLEMADKSFRGPDDISRQLGLSVIGHVPVIRKDKKRRIPKGEPVSPAIMAYHRPRSRDAEAFRAVRAAVYFGSKGQANHVIQVTSPNPGDGKSTLAANLAVTIAQSGKRCLLIDADCRRPQVHTLFSLPNEEGLSSLLADGVELPDVVQPGPLPGLELLTTGPPVRNPGELVCSPRFAELLALVREKYDYVIVDTPPLLAVSDPANVAAHVDGVLLVTRITKQNRPHAIRAKETLDLVGANILGVVVNGLDDSAVHGFGTGKYGYRSTSYHPEEHYGGDYRYRAYASDYYAETEDLPAEPLPIRNGRHADGTTPNS